MVTCSSSTSPIRVWTASSSPTISLVVWMPAATEELLSCRAAIWSVTRWVALLVSRASSLTSLATTAKPLPSSPARAASIVALSASRLVWSAIPEMTWMTSPIATDA
jgi:hypothetical protein